MGVMEGLISAKLQLCFLWIQDFDFKNIESFEFFWIWVAKQPIKKLWFNCGLMNTAEEVRWRSSNLLPLSFQHCRKLTLYSLGNFQNGDLKFPNVREMTLSADSAECFRGLASAVPRLERLYCKVIGNAWNILTTGATTERDALESLFGARTPERPQIGSPLGEFKGEFIIKMKQVLDHSDFHS
jgi:hypothetical protein